MMMSTIRCVLVGCLATLVPGVAIAQAVRVGAVKPKPNMAVSSLSLSATPASVNFQLVAKGVATGSGAVQITTTWGGSLCLFTCSINVYAYFSSANAALAGGSPVVDIPTSEVLGQVPTGTPTTYTPFTQTSPFGGGGASLQLFQQTFTLFAGGNSRTDALNLEINLTNQPQLPAGTYTGTLFIEAQSL
jgi:hypothetical protein